MCSEVEKFIWISTPESHPKWNEMSNYNIFGENDDGDGDGGGDDDDDEIKCAHGNRTFVTTMTLMVVCCVIKEEEEEFT